MKLVDFNSETFVIDFQNCNTYSKLVEVDTVNMEIILKSSIKLGERAACYKLKTKTCKKNIKSSMSVRKHNTIFKYRS